VHFKLYLQVSSESLIDAGMVGRSLCDYGKVNTIAFVSSRDLTQRRFVEAGKQADEVSVSRKNSVRGKLIGEESRTSVL
jgi:hypothetical protein